MHTIIVGAGIAGLWLADQLSQQGDTVTILEKYDYLGGRILTAKTGYEIGAGRIHSSHRHVAALLRRYKLHTSPLSPDSMWLSQKAVAEAAIPNHFDDAWQPFLDLLNTLHPTVLATHTLKDLAGRIMGPARARQLLDQFPYRAEVERLRADLGIQSFQNEMGSSTGYSVVKEGLTAIVRGLEHDLRRRGAQIFLNAEVTDIKDTTVHTKGGGHYSGDRVVLALHASALRHLPATRDLPILKHLVMAPLTRIYAAYPHLNWLGPIRIVTDSPLRYIIPVNPAKGIVMISYTDDRDTRHWAGLKGAALQREIQHQVRQLFPDRAIPEPEWVKPYEWEEGCTYWRPGAYDPKIEAQAAMTPRPGLYICGESLSVGRQAWIEGALESAELLNRMLNR